MSWQFFAVINVLAGSLIILIQRLLLHRDQSDPIAFVVVSQTLTAVFVGTIALIHGFRPPDFAKLWLPISVMFGLYSIGHVIYAKTLKQVEASVFTTLLNTNTIWVVLMGFVLFKEHPNGRDLLGTALILVSVAILAEKLGKIRLNKSLGMGLLTGLIFGLAASLWIYVGRHSDLLTWTALSFAGTPLIVFLANLKVVPKIKVLLHGRALQHMLLLAFFFGVSNMASLAAYQRGRVSVIAPLTTTNVVVTVLLAIVFLKERTRIWHKLTAAVICFLGVLLIIK